MNKTIIFIAITTSIIIGILFFIRQRKKIVNNYVKSDESVAFYSLDDGNQTEVIYAPKYNKEFLENLDKKYSWQNFDEYDNRFWEYMYEYFDKLPKIAGEEMPNQDFFNKLNRPQKVFYCMLVFNGDVDNGGVNQFFFNKPEFAFAVLETFEELKLPKLKNDYEKCLNELMGNADSYGKRKQIFNDENKSWEKRWKAFTDGYAEIKSAEKLEDYYYDKEFKKEYYKHVVEYIDKNIDKFTEK